jgi:hypothetical protein
LLLQKCSVWEPEGETVIGKSFIILREFPVKLRRKDGRSAASTPMWKEGES